MAINKAAMKALLEVLSEADDNGGQTPPANPAPPTPAPKQDDDVKAALEARLVELEQKIASGGDAGNNPVEPPKENNEESEEVKELRRRVEEQESLAVSSAIKTGLAEHDIDPEAFDVLSEFFEYGKLKAEDGSADTEKIARVVDTLTSIALRKPPSNPGANKPYNPLNQGLGKYLDKK